MIFFIFQRGKCRYCGKKISWQYPLVELFTGIFFCLAFIKYFGIGGMYELTSYKLQVKDYFFLLRDWLFLSTLIVIFVYDLKHSLILDKITLPIMVLAFLINLFLKPLPLTSYLFGGIMKRDTTKE